MTIEINGQMQSVPPVPNVRELLRYLDISEDRIAVEINRRIIRRKEWETTAVGDRDQVEIVQFVGGG